MYWPEEDCVSVVSFRKVVELAAMRTRKTEKPIQRRKSEIRRKERTQVVQESTGTFLDEAVHDTTLTAALEVKHITVVADIAKEAERQIKDDAESNRRKAEKHGVCDGKHAE